MTESQLRRLTAVWPGVEAGMKWEDDLVFTVAGKMFCVTCVRGPHKGAISFKVEDERFLELTGQPGFLRRRTSPARAGCRCATRRRCPRPTCPR